MEATTPVPLQRSTVPEDLPPSAKTLYETLALEGPLTHKELVEITGMPPRTIRYAISRLQETNHVSKRLNLMDSRQQFFFLQDDDGSMPSQL